MFSSISMDLLGYLHRILLEENPNLATKFASREKN